MRKTFFIFLFFFLGLTSLLYPTETFAQCTVEPQQITMEDICSQFSNNIYDQFKLKVSKDYINQYTGEYNRLGLEFSSLCFVGGHKSVPITYNVDSTSDPIVLTFPQSPGCTTLMADSGSHTVTLQLNPPGGIFDPGTWVPQDLCTVQYTISPNTSSCKISVTPKTGIGDVESEWGINITDIVPEINQCTQQGYKVIYPDALGTATKTDNRFTAPFDRPYNRNIGKISRAGSYDALVISDNGALMCNTNFNVAPFGSTPLPTITPTITPSPVPPSPTYDPTQPSWTPIPPIPSLAPICDQIDPQYSGTCWNCINTGGIWTAIGCLPTDWGRLISEKIFPIGAGLGGGTSFLYFLYGVFLILTSAGNAEKIAEGKEIIISALSGLFLIIFSVFLLRVIGYDILRIPGFG